MARLNFSLNVDGTSRFYELLTCLAKFGEFVSLEAKADKLTITGLNISRTACASFTLDARRFFIDYSFEPSASTRGNDRFTCQLYNKALQSVFKGRTGDRGRDPVERCNAHLQEQADQTECRLVMKMLFRNGTTKIYRLTYESVEVMHALFDKAAAKQGWRISARVLREYIEYFGSKTEQLDMLAQEDKIVLTSFTEKIHDGKEILKQPLETAIAIHIDDFEDFHMQQDMHIVISVRDFKAIVTHAETLRGSIAVYFSFPNRPLQFTYHDQGLQCEFTLMSTGDIRPASSTSMPKLTSNRSSRQSSVLHPSVSGSTTVTVNPNNMTSDMLPPLRPLTAKTMTTFNSANSLPRTKPQVPISEDEEEEEQDPNSLFVPGENDDRSWDPPNFDKEEEEEELLGWDANNEATATPHATFHDSGRSADGRNRNNVSLTQTSEGLPPTQRLSQLHGMFD